MHSNILLSGDINFHLELRNDPFTVSFMSLLDDHSLSYHIDFVKTHCKGGSLDIVCTKGIECLDLTVEDLRISDHFMIACGIGIPRKVSNGSNSDNCSILRRDEYRDYKGWNVRNFRSLLLMSAARGLVYMNMTLNSYACDLFGVFQDSLDRFAPKVFRNSRVNHSKLYHYSPEVAEAQC